MAIGEPGALDGFALAGATVVGASDPEEVRRAWGQLPADVALVVLTENAASALSGSLGSSRVLHVVVPP